MSVSKQKLREQMLARLRQQAPEVRARSSRRITQRVLRTPHYQSAQRVLCYVALPHEVDTWPLLWAIISDGKQLAVPVTKPDRQIMPIAVSDPNAELTKRNSYGLVEPSSQKAETIPVEQIDLVVVPGLAFDNHGNRLGRGLGYFDRFLRNLPENTATVGVAFSWQRVREVPTEAHDFPVQEVITN